jgi:hypothetical protein
MAAMGEAPDTSTSFEPAAPVLDYANPPVFLRAQFAFRTKRSALISVVLAAGAVAFGTVAISAPSGGTGAQLYRAAFAAAAVLLLLFSGFLIWGWITDRRDTILITEDGIARNRRFWRWQNIQHVRGLIYTHGVSIEFFPRGHVPRELVFTPPMSEAQYAKLATLLRSHVVPRHPHLKVEATAEYQASD